MDLVFTTDNFQPAKRYNAWREAICDFYVHVDVNATRPEEGGGRSITSIAFDNGFNRSVHFSTMFKRKYGIAPRDVARARV